MLQEVPTLVRTVRYLRLSQVGWRLYYRALRPLEVKRWYHGARRIEQKVSNASVACAVPTTPLDIVTDFGAADIVHELAQGKLTLLNQTLPFRNGDDWCMTGGRDSERLWKHTLHYHQWLLPLGAAVRSFGCVAAAAALDHTLNDWLFHCRPGEPGFAHYAWNSYAISSRLDSWRQLLCLLPISFWQPRAELRRMFLKSFTAQAAYLDAHLEWDLRGNHLLRDALGLACAGRSFEGSDARHWLRRATTLAAGQADEQVLADGGHFERSPAYHLVFMNDLAKLSTLLVDRSVVDHLRRTWNRMAEFARWMQFSDGTCPQFNDGAVVSVSCLPDRTDDTENPVELPLLAARHFSESGIIVWRGHAWRIFFDVGRVGPDYQPGHAHADTLTVECEYGGRRLFVDPGCYAYDNDARREYDRSTAAHNTVCIDQTNSSEVWHIFRTGRRAYPENVRVNKTRDSLQAAAEHDGYDHLPGRPRHRRTLEVAEDGTLTITDDIEGNGHHQIDGGFLLDPAWTARPLESGWELNADDKTLRVNVRANQTLDFSIQRRPIHPNFGIEKLTSRIVWNYCGGLPLTVSVRITPR